LMSLTKIHFQADELPLEPEFGLRTVV
jgi:hypothetical protein